MIDTVEFAVVAGDGGDGAISFRREKFVPRGGPDGGDGGDGGDVMLVTDPQRSTLQHYHDRRAQQADNGSPGEGNRRRGASGDDMIVPRDVHALCNFARHSPRGGESQGLDRCARGHFQD